VQIFAISVKQPAKGKKIPFKLETSEPGSRKLKFRSRNKVF